MMEPHSFRNKRFQRVARSSSGVSAAGRVKKSRRVSMSGVPVRRLSRQGHLAAGQTTQEEAMRPLVVTTFVTMDGVMQAPGGPQEDTDGGFAHGGWVVPHFDEAMGNQMSDWFAPAEDFLLGRRTYQIFASHWPYVEGDDPVTVGLQTKTKHVASRTLTSPLDWDTARLLEGDVVEAVRALKATDGGELQVHGSHGLIQTLLREDLVDELRLIVFPVVVGPGKRLFEDGAVPRTWRLVDCTPSTTGALMCTYRFGGELETGAFGLDTES
jgi:dihydrofolate reductase